MTARLDFGFLGFSSIEIATLSESTSTIPNLLGSLTLYPNITALPLFLTASSRIGEKPWPQKILSPRIRQTRSFPIKSSPIMKALPIPSGLSYIL